jgi:hypothetical protein
MTNVTLKTTDGETISIRKIGNGKTYQWALIKFGKRIASSTESTIHIANLGNSQDSILRKKSEYETYWKDAVEMIPVIDGIATITSEQVQRLVNALPSARRNPPRRATACTVQERNTDRRDT